ncbi:MAG: DNA primase small subunit domain-containing protein [Candidatus Thorarchaeota archaeon]
MSSREREKRQKFLRLMFQQYYRNHAADIDIPDRLHMREFALETWEYTWRCTRRAETDAAGQTVYVGCGRKGTAIQRPSVCPVCNSPTVTSTNWSRHLGFRTAKAMRSELAARAPHSVYHSAAFYNIPVARDMQEKQWQGAELVFDIDADHLDAPCTQEHDSWVCANPNCMKTGWGEPPEQGCPSCGGLEFHRRKWICDRCMDDARRNTLRVYDEFLVGDFGIDSDQIVINYSGHRGYHIRVRDPRVFKLDSAARVEIAHEITGVGFDGNSVVGTTLNIPQAPARSLAGWGGRVVDAIVNLIRNIDSYEGGQHWVSRLRRNREAIIAGLLKNPPEFWRGAGISVKSWREIATVAVAMYGGKIDVPVTHDVHRVIRLIGSIHGKTGFVVAKLTRESIEDFDPFADALAFGADNLRVRVLGGLLEVPRFRIGDELYGPYGDEVVDLPMSAAMFLLCKGVAVLG